MQQDETEQLIKGDRALGPGGTDRLGFRDIAARIATSLVSSASDDGLVIGIDGKWGSGKSSLMYLVESELSQMAPERRPTLIRFQPWLIGDRDALMTGLFRDIATSLDQAALVRGDATRASIAKIHAAAAALRGFLNGLSQTGKVVEVVGDASGIGWIKWAGKVLAAIDKRFGKSEPKALAERKEALAKALQALGHRFVVIIDDVDRLEPREALEILRLVRSVVDLPNIIYLLCYDSTVLGHSLEKLAGIENGLNYLEKIVQLSIMVPAPEPLQLRQWLSDELLKFATVKNEDERARLAAVIDYEGGRQLRTPRSVMRVLDGLRFLWPPLHDVEGDLADLVWLQLIKDGNPPLYRWIEDYCGTAAHVALRTAMIDQTESARKLSELLAVVPSGQFGDTMYTHYFAEPLPGVSLSYKDAAPFTLFGHIEREERDAAICARRLASPDHFRLYFALGDPGHALTPSEVSTVMAAAEQGHDELHKELMDLHAEIVSGSLTKADILLERLRGGAYGELDALRCEAFLLSFAHGMDELYAMRPFAPQTFNSLWDRAQDALPRLLTALPLERRMEAVSAMFGQGAAISWLTGVFRKETFIQGRYGNRGRHESEWRLTKDLLDLAGAQLLARYRVMTWDEIIATISPADLLFAWQQGGDEKGPAGLFAQRIADDEAMLATLETLTDAGAVNSSARRDVLYRRNLEAFVEYDAFVGRLRELAENGQHAVRAGNLLSIFEAVSQRDMVR